MTEQQRLEVIREIHLLKKIHYHHSQDEIIEDEQERMQYLDTILDRIRELEAFLKNDSTSQN
jgi:hypothetical protein